MVSFVVDASATLPWCFRDEANEKSNELLKRLRGQEEAVAPPHWPIEFGNALLTGARRKRIPMEDAIRFLADLQSLPIEIRPVTHPVIQERIFPLAEKHSLTLYDAAYLDLALTELISLTTLDTQLRKAARAGGVALLL